MVDARVGRGESGRRDHCTAVLMTALAILATATSACDETPKGAPPSASASAAPTTPAAPAPTPAAPSKPQLAVDDTAAFVSGERIDLGAPDPAGRYATVLASKKVDGEDLVLEAARDAKFPKIALIVAAAAKANAKSLLVHTPKRDRSQGEVLVALRKMPGKDAPDCSAVGFISKDNSTTAQTAAGQKGARFTKGMAGPDMTRSSEGIRKVAAACESNVWFVSADPEITWGVVADLVFSVATPDDGGTAVKANEVVVLPKPPGGGRKVE
jgi:hypothetical protein